MARRVGGRSFGRHRAWLLTENREEQGETQGSWTGSQPMAPEPSDEPHRPGDKAFPPGRLEQTLTGQSCHEMITVTFNPGTP
jgi:hypothetical protein